MLGISKRRIPDGFPGAGVAILRVHYSADPKMTAERVEQLRKTYTSKARWDREMEIAYEALEGELYYPEWNREANTCEPFDVSNPDIWTIYMGCDPHTRTPTAMAWVAFNAYGDSVVCGELWPSARHFVFEMADAVRLFESDSMYKPSPFDWACGKKLKIYQRYMDTFGSGADVKEGTDYFKAYREEGLVFQPALKSQGRIGAARDEIGHQLTPVEITMGNSVQWRAPMRVFEGCEETIREFERVRYPEGEPLRPSDEKPLTYRKHCLDCITYIQTASPSFVLQRRGDSGFEPIYPNLGR